MYKWYVLGVLLVVNMVAFIDRTVFALLITPISEDLQISDTAISLLHGAAFALFYTAMSIPMGRLVDQGNRRNILAVAAGFWSLMTAACGLARDYWTLFAARLGVGLGESALSPAAYSIIADYFERRTLGLAMSIYMFGVYLGIGLALIIGGTVIGALTEIGGLTLPVVGTLKPWQLTFIIVGLPGVLLALWLLTVREPTRRRTAAEVRQGTIPLPEVAAYTRRHWRAYAAHIVGFTFLGIMAYAQSAWTPTFFVRTYDWSLRDAGVSVGLVVMGFSAMGLLLGGFLADRWIARGARDGYFRVAMIGILAVVPLTALMALAPSGQAALAWLAPQTFFSSWSFGVAAASLQVITPNRMRGVMTGLYLIFFNGLGVSLGPLVVGLSTDYLFADPMALRYSLIVVTTAAGVLSLMVFAIGRGAYARRFAAVEAEQAAG